MLHGETTYMELKKKKNHHNQYLRYSKHCGQTVYSSSWLKQYILGCGSTRRLGRGVRHQRQQWKNDIVLSIWTLTLEKNP